MRGFVNMWTNPADQTALYGVCGQAMDKKTINLSNLDSNFKLTNK